MAGVVAAIPFSGWFHALAGVPGTSAVLEASASGTGCSTSGVRSRVCAGLCTSASGLLDLRGVSGGATASCASLNGAFHGHHKVIDVDMADLVVDLNQSQGAVLLHLGPTFPAHGTGARRLRLLAGNYAASWCCDHGPAVVAAASGASLSRGWASPQTGGCIAGALGTALLGSHRS